MNVLHSLSELPADAAFDVAVIGAGGAGMVAALVAALEGQRVLLVEKTDRVGGTTALSGGTTWVPGTHHSASVNPSDTLADASRYLDSAVGDRTPAALRQAFLEHGAQAVRYLEDRSAVRFRPVPKHPDYISELPGSTLCGRALEPLPFDGRLLGPLFELVRAPIPEFTVLGGMMVDRIDIGHLLARKKSFASFKYSACIVLRHMRDRLRYGRGTRLVMGNALAARLLYALSQQPTVTLLLNTGLQALARNEQGVHGVTLQGQGTLTRELAIAKGVVLASGGFNRHPEMRQAYLPGVDMQWCPGAPGHTGQAHAPAQAVGAVYGQNGLSHAFWAPVSLRKRADGSTAVFPHFVFDRAKPGMVTVNARGERFVNESTSYHLFGIAMQQTGSVPAYLIADAPALQRYGMGMVRPQTPAKALQPFLDDGYLVAAPTLAELAHKLGIPAQALEQTVQTFNRYAEQGIDPDFQRGQTAYSNNIGDASLGLKNPNMAPLVQGPFYAVTLYPGDIGSATGFVTDGHARVLDAQALPIAGLYAVGNDMHSVMGGVYTAPGITIGPSVVFGYLAAKHASART